MNVRLRFNTDIRAGIWLSDQFLINNFSINLQLITQSNNPEDHSVCMGRIRTVLDGLENSVFINQTHTDKIKQLIDCGLRVTAFPHEPIDQIIGVVLYEKLNAVLEGRMCVTDLDICSDSDNIWFMHSNNEKISAVPDNGWWAESTPECNVSENNVTGKKVVKLRKLSSWKHLDLGWQSDQPSETVIINIKDEK
jgi:hypothetical protein